jgi:hypothetical protein
MGHLHERQAFLMMKTPESGGSPSEGPLKINTIPKWFEEMKKWVPVA